MAYIVPPAVGLLVSPRSSHWTVDRSRAPQYRSVAVSFESSTAELLPTCVQPGSGAESLIANRAITGLAIGVLLGGLGQFLFQLWGLWKPVLRPIMRLPRGIPWSKDIYEVLILMTPMVIAASAAQVKVVINLIFAAGLQEGAVTWLSFAFRLLQLPIGLCGVAVGAWVSSGAGVGSPPPEHVPCFLNSM